MMNDAEALLCLCLPHESDQGHCPTTLAPLASLATAPALADCGVSGLPKARCRSRKDCKQSPLHPLLCIRAAAGAGIGTLGFSLWIVLWIRPLPIGTLQAIEQAMYQTLLVMLAAFALAISLERIPKSDCNSR